MHSSFPSVRWDHARRITYIDLEGEIAFALDYSKAMPPKGVILVLGRFEGDQQRYANGIEHVKSFLTNQGWIVKVMGP